MESSSPTGPLSVLLGAERKNLIGTGSDGLVGIAARTGVYRFLDLPGRATGDGTDRSDVALSPDGRWVAYRQERAASRVVGAAAYDTRTGRVRRLPLASWLGVAPDSLNWVDDVRLLVGWGTVTSTSPGQSTARSQPSVLWTPGGPAREVGGVLGGFRPAPGGLSASDGTAVELLNDDLRTSERHGLGLSRVQSPLGDVLVSADGQGVLVVSDSDRGRNRLLIGPLVGDGLPRSGRGPAARPVDLRPVDLGALVPEAVLAAPDARHLLVLGHVGTATRGVYSVDASTGSSRQVVIVPSQVFGADVQFASDLWDRARSTAPVHRGRRTHGGSRWVSAPRSCWASRGGGGGVPSSESFDAYVAARYASLTRTAYLLTGHHQDAEDLVQSALLEAVGVWRRIEDSPDAYVRRIMVNENVSRWRRHRGREVVVGAVPDRGHSPRESDDVLMLRDALAGLAPRQRAVIVLRYYEDLTERETAELLGIAVGTVKSQARDALARLRAAGVADRSADQRSDSMAT